MIFKILALLALSLSVGWTKPVDLVYVWVDGEDPAWQAVKEQYSGTTETEKCVSDAKLKCRFANRDELKYSLRSVWKYAPFFHHIYLVTMGQRPEWLAAHPLITVVDHQEIFTDPNHLPTFNSQAIESHLHQIPGLEEYFIYFNDDFFLGQPVTEEDFFTADGHVRVCFEKWRSPSGPADGCESSYRLAWRNTNALLDQRFFPMTRYRLCHAPYALRKSYMAFSAMEFSEAFQATSSHRFRCSFDYNITNGLLQYHWFVLGWMETGSLSNQLVDLIVENDSHLEKTKQTLQKIQANTPATFCMEDNLRGENPQTERLIHDFLEELYPDPAPWESTTLPDCSYRCKDKE